MYLHIAMDLDVDIDTDIDRDLDVSVFYHCVILRYLYTMHPSSTL